MTYFPANIAWVVNQPNIDYRQAAVHVKWVASPQTAEISAINQGRACSYWLGPMNSWG
jgi:hypothetical protein